MLPIWVSYKAKGNSSYGNGYLNIGYQWRLLNLKSSSCVSQIDENSGSVGCSETTVSNGIRPSIIIKSGIILSGGGTKTSPYILSADFDKSNINDNLYTRHSGEYIKFDTDGDNGNYDNAPLFRIVGVEGEGDSRTTKIVAMDYATYDVTDTETGTTTTNNTKSFASTVNYGATGNTSDNAYWDYYLNNDWYDNLSFKNKITNGIYYIGTIGTTANYNYKMSICKSDLNYKTCECLVDATKRVNTKFTGLVGLLRYGEMFATQKGMGKDSSNSIWLISKYGYMSNYIIVSVVSKEANSSFNAGYSSSKLSVRPSYYLKSDVKILSGSGTELDPYIVD